MSCESPNMKLRMPGKDYTDPGYYFCTLVVEGRRQLFGSVVSVSNAVHQSHDTQNQSDNSQHESPALGCGGENVLRSLLNNLYPYGHSTPHDGACMVYSPYGQFVIRELKKIGTEGQYQGKVQVKGKVVMPDHIHILFYISERLPKPLGHVINGFAVGCRRLWKELCGIKLKQTEPTMVFESCANEVKTGKWNLPEEQRIWPMEQTDGALRIFEKGYNDNVVYRQGQLDGYYKYMTANPWRWLMKDRYPELFCKVWAKELLPGQQFDLIGNMFLLDRPWKVPVRISRFAVDEEAFNPYAPQSSFVLANGKPVLRRTQYMFPRREKTQEEIQAAIEPYLKLARAGAVLVTPCISPAEKEVVQAAYKENRVVVMLCFQGFGKYYHPTKAHYDACARGLLLQLAPWKFDPGREMRKAQCEELNSMAFRFAGILTEH